MNGKTIVIQLFVQPMKNIYAGSDRSNEVRALEDGPVGLNINVNQRMDPYSRPFYVYLLFRFFCGPFALMGAIDGVDANLLTNRSGAEKPIK